MEIKTLKWLALFCVSIVLFSGCNTLSKNRLVNPISKLTAPKQAAPAEPYKVVAVWKDAVATSTEGKTLRGFAGRVYFLDDAENIVPVSGEVTVYGFDDSTTTQKNSEPDQKIVYSPKQLEGLQSDSKMGVAYSLWVPWDDQITGYQKDISLVTIFKTNSGRVIKGEMVRANLPGDKDPNLSARMDFYQHFNRSLEKTRGISKVAHAEDELQAKRKRTMETTTISLTPNLRDRINELSQNGQLTVSRVEELANEQATKASNVVETIPTRIPEPKASSQSTDLQVESIEERSPHRNFHRVKVGPIGSNLRRRR